MWENVDSWLVYANQVFRIAQPYFSTDLLKEVGTSFFFPVFKTVNEKIKFLTRWYCFNRYNLSIQNEIIIKNLFIYTALAKHRWVTKLEGFNRKSWKPQKIIIAVRKLFNKYVHSWEGFPKGVCMLLYLQFCHSIDQWKETMEQRFFQQFDRYLCIKLIVTIIPTYPVINLLSSSFFLSLQTKTKDQVINKWVVW